MPTERISFPFVISDNVHNIVIVIRFFSVTYGFPVVIGPNDDVNQPIQ